MARPQFFAGVWGDDTKELTLILETKGDCGSEKASYSNDTYLLDHISMIRNRLVGTFRSNGRKLMEIQGIINGNTMNFGLRDILLRVSQGDKCLKYV
jgi:hypothetical protein